MKTNLGNEVGEMGAFGIGMALRGDDGVQSIGPRFANEADTNCFPSQRR